jgi:hypothetical protein
MFSLLRVSALVFFFRLYLRRGHDERQRGYVKKPNCWIAVSFDEDVVLGHQPHCRRRCRPFQTWNKECFKNYPPTIAFLKFRQVHALFVCQCTHDSQLY